MHILRGQIVHLRWYRRKHQYAADMVSGRNRWREIRMIGTAIREHGLFSGEALRWMGRVYTTNTYFLVLSRGGLYVALIAICAWGSYGHSGEWVLSRGPSLWLLAWTCVWIVPFVLTSTKHFRFLGESERYAEYGILPAAMLVGVALGIAPASGIVLGVMLLYGFSAVGIIGHAWAVNARVARGGTRDREELLGALRQLPAGSMLLGIPAMQVLAPVASRLPHQYADIAVADGAAFVRTIETQFEGYPWPKPDWEMWRSLGVDYVVTFSPEYLRMHRPSLPYDRIPLDLIYSNPSYRVYAYPREDGGGRKED
jgi:hypothetical protein